MNLLMPSPPAPSPSFAARARRVLRERGALYALRHGFRRLVSPVCELGALHFFARELERSPSQSPPVDGAGIREATAAEIDRVIAGSDPQRPPGALAERFRRGDRCFVVTDAAGDVLHSRWLTKNGPYLPELRRSLRLPPSTAYFYDGYTRPQARGRGLDARARSAIFATLAGEGCGRVLSYVRGDNAVGLRAARRAQTEVGRIRYLRVGSRALLLGRSGTASELTLMRPSGTFDEGERAARAERWRQWFESWLDQPAERRSTGFDALPDEYFAAISSFVAETLELSAQADSVLDVGCDSAMVSRRVAPRCRRLTGVDLVPGLLWNAPRPRASGERPPDLMLASDARLLPFPTGSFDKVYCLSMIHTLPSHEDAYRVVAELVRVCAPGGRVLVGSVPDRSRRGRALREGWRRGSGPERLRIVASLLLPDAIKPWLGRVTGLAKGPELVSLEFDFGALGEAAARPRSAIEWRVVPFADDFWSRDFRATRANLLISVPPAGEPVPAADSYLVSATPAARSQEGRGPAASEPAPAESSRTRL